MGATKSCQWLHEHLEGLPIFKYHEGLLSDGHLPDNGIYFFYQKGETWRHGGSRPRIVRVGTHRGDGNFPHRIGEHFLTDGRSIFRKNIGRALLHREGDDYLKIWTLDFIEKLRRLRRGTSAEAACERGIQRRVTAVLHRNFWFRFIVVDEQDRRREWESRLIGTVAGCPSCRPSAGWLGRYSPIERIRTGKMWLVQHLDSEGIDETASKAILGAIGKTEGWVKSQRG
jgi:hypothetical protein